MADPRSIAVADLLTKDVVVVGPDDSLADALKLLVKHEVSALPVVMSNGHCVGVLSGTDLLNLTREMGEAVGATLFSNLTHQRTFIEALLHAQIESRKVRDVMSNDVVSVELDASLQTAAAKMVEAHVHRVVILDDDGKLAGIVSTMDLLAEFSRNG